MWERSTSRHNVVIIKDSIGCGYRSFDGSPVPEDVSDHQLLESFQTLYDIEAWENAGYQPTGLGKGSMSDFCP